MSTATAEDLSNEVDDSSPAPTSVNGVKAEELKRVIDRIERLETDKTGINEDIKLVKQEAKSEGFDLKTLNQILKIRKKDSATLEQEELLLEVYKRALGMTD